MIMNGNDIKHIDEFITIHNKNSMIYVYHSTNKISKHNSDMCNGNKNNYEKINNIEFYVSVSEQKSSSLSGHYEYEKIYNLIKNHIDMDFTYKNGKDSYTPGVMSFNKLHINILHFNNKFILLPTNNKDFYINNNLYHFNIIKLFIEKEEYETALKYINIILQHKKDKYKLEYISLKKQIENKIQ